MQEILEKWKGIIDERFYKNASIIEKEEFEDLTAEARCHWERMEKGSGRTYLWSDLINMAGTTALTRNFVRLRHMTIALHTTDSALEGNEQLSKDIVDALDWLIANRYSVDAETGGNWWDWEIGVPIALTEMILLMSPYLSEEQIKAYLAPVDQFTPDPEMFLNSTPNYPTMKSTGANRVWICRVIALRSLILRDEAMLLRVRDALSPLFEYVTGGEGGFCEDGSFLQHGYPYTGGYGKSMLSSLIALLHVLEGTPFEVIDPNKERIYDWVYQSFEPLIFRGSLMDMVSGREASRYDLQNHESGHTAIGAMLELSTFAPQPHADQIKQLVKYWLLEDTSKSFMTNNPQYLQYIADHLLNDASIPAQAPSSKYKMYAGMARAVQQRPSYAFGISLFSNRVPTYESINGEHKKGWYSGHGHTSLYNGDLEHYSDGYWPTVDPYRLAGITVTNERREDSFGNWFRSCESWSGGVELQGLYGTAGMALEDYKSESVEEPLRALKSWFLFEGEIVALGSDIQYNGPFQVETIVDNRKLNPEGTNELIVNGVQMPAQPGWSADKMPITKWIHLKGEATGDDIGYFFPQGAALQGKRDTRIGRWSDVGNGPDKEIARHYFTIGFNHGPSPLNDSYAYVILPGKTASEMERYSAEPNVEIIEQSSAVHAVYHSSLGILAANFWTDQLTSAKYVTCSRKASVMVKTSGTEVEIVVSDPTHENNGFIELELQLAADKVLEADPRIEVLQLSPVVKLQFHAKDSNGATSKIRLSQ